MTAADVLWGRAELGATATFCSECGAPEQVGMAQRMESVTPPGGVMLSASTAQLVDSSAVLGEAVLVQIKGADKPVRARRLLGIGDRHRAGRAESNLVGRRWEMSAVEGLLDRAIDGHGAVVGVVGPPGIGKSRLLREAAAMARQRSGSVHYLLRVAHQSGPLPCRRTAAARGHRCRGS
jgi:adenylate cyclase